MRARTSTMRSKALNDGEPRWRVVAVARQHTDVIDGPDGLVRTRGIDVSKPDASNALGIVLAKYAPVDVLINNAAVCIGRECAVGNVDYRAWTRSFETNVFGAMRVLEAALPHLARDAVVVNVSGRMGSIGRVMAGLGASSATTQDVVYRTTKAALNMMTVCAAAEFKAKDETRDVKVVAVDPGWMNTDMGSRGGTVTGAPLEPEDSAAGIVALIAGLKPEDSGKFLNWRGEESPLTMRDPTTNSNVVKTQETNGSLSPGVMTMGSPFQSLTTLLPGGYSIRSIPPSSPPSPAASASSSTASSSSAASSFLVF